MPADDGDSVGGADGIPLGQHEDRPLRALVLTPHSDLRRTVTGSLPIEIAKSITFDLWEADTGPPSAIILREYDILVTGWGAPMLPAELAEDQPDAASASPRRTRYVLHLTGELRNIVPRAIVRSPQWIVTNWGTAISRFVAEMNLALLLAAARRIPEAKTSITSGQWKERLAPGTTLLGKVVGLFGYGRIARDFVRLLEPFGCHMLVYDPYVSAQEVEGIERVHTVEELFDRASIVSLHAGLTPETEGRIGYDLLSRLPEDGIVINTARAGLIDEDALLRAVRQTSLRFGLDVYHREPPDRESEIVRCDRVVCTPHTGGEVGTAMYEQIRQVALENLRRYLAGHRLYFIVDEELYDRMT